MALYTKEFARKMYQAIQSTKTNIKIEDSNEVSPYGYPLSSHIYLANAPHSSRRSSTLQRPRQ